MKTQTLNAAYARAKKHAATAGTDQAFWVFHADKLREMLSNAGITRGRPRLAWEKKWRRMK